MRFMDDIVADVGIQDVGRRHQCRVVVQDAYLHPLHPFPTPGQEKLPPQHTTFPLQLCFHIPPPGKWTRYKSIQ